jgi:antitoxin YefM
MIATYSDFRQKLKGYLDKVFESRTPLHITRAKGENFVVLSEAEYEGIMETFYLLKSPENARRLIKAVEEHQAGKGKERKLIES